MKPIFWRVFKIIISILCFTAIYHWVDFQKLSEKFRNLFWLPFSIAILLNLFFLLFNAIKTRYLFSDPRPTLINVIKVNFITVFFRSFLPGGIGGEFARWAYMSQNLNTKNESLNVILVERTTGIITQIIFGVFASFWILYFNPSNDSALLYKVLIFLVLISVLFGACLRLNKRIFIWLQKREHSKFLWIKNIASIINDVTNTLIEVAKSPQKLFNIVFLCLLNQISNIGIFILIDRSLGGDLSWTYASLFLTGFTLISALPISFGNWGVSEGALGILYQFSGSQTETGIMFSLLIRIMNLVPAIIGWFYFLSFKSEK